MLEAEQNSIPEHGRCSVEGGIVTINEGDTGRQRRALIFYNKIYIIFYDLYSLPRASVSSRFLGHAAVVYPLGLNKMS